MRLRDELGVMRHRRGLTQRVDTAGGAGRCKHRATHVATHVGHLAPAQVVLAA
jgi:hypothetical protein